MARLQVEVAHEIFRGVFHEFPLIETILLTVPAAAGEFAPIKDIFTRVSRLSGPDGSFRLLRTSRTAFIPAVVVREARVEDHDDLVPVSE